MKQLLFLLLLTLSLLAQNESFSKSKKQLRKYIKVIKQLSTVTVSTTTKIKRT